MRHSKICKIVVGIILSCGLAFEPQWAFGRGQVFTRVPERVDPSQRYMFYLHGAWIERHGLNRPHPRHGRYDYKGILAALSDKGWVVISEARTSDVGFLQYAGEVADQVSYLLRRRVPPENITVMGHSKGGLMSLIAASLLREEKVNFVVLAGCGRPGADFRRYYQRFLATRAPAVKGRILSLYDDQDREAGSCREAFASAARVTTHEVVFRTGRGHGLFFSPEAAWIDEVVRWMGSS